MVRKELHNDPRICQQAINHISEVLFIISPDWKTVYFITPSYETVWGKTCESLRENSFSWTDSIHPEDRDIVIQYIEEKANGDLDNISFPDYRIVKPNGSIIWIQAKGIPLYNEKGEVYRIVGIAIDITDRKKMEVERDELIHSLQHALDEIKTLKGIIPICSYCKNIRDNDGAWDKVEAYIARHSDAEFSHGIFPKCFEQARANAHLTNPPKK